MRIVLKKNEERRIRKGGLWIFSNELEKPPASAQAGWAEVYTFDGRFVGTGFYNPASLIAVRIFSKHEETVDRAFLEDRIAAALSYRRDAGLVSDGYRLLFGESDGLPGVVADIYGTTASVIIYSLAAATLIEPLVGALTKTAGVERVYVRTDHEAAQLEKIEPVSGWLAGSDPGPIMIREGKVSFEVDVASGQKSGFFFDQRDNRLRVAELAPKRNVLDLYCYTGGFSLHAAGAGAATVTGVDSSEAALATASRSAAANNLKNVTFIKDDAERFIASAGAGRFDLVIADPPGLIRSRKHFFEGVKKYAAINAAAIAAVRPGGFVVTSSCSRHLPFAEFVPMLATAAALARRKIRVMRYGFQSGDHPILPSMEETIYLKTAFLRVE